MKAYISYGILIESKNLLPWNSPEFNGNFERWWMVANGFDPASSTEDRRRWKEKHPPPVEILNLANDTTGEDAAIIAHRSSVTTAEENCPEEIDRRTIITDENADIKLVEFCREYNIPFHDFNGPSWRLTCGY